MGALDPLREHLISLLEGKGAHAPFDNAIADFPEGLRGAKPDGAPHTAWQLLEHMRITQADMLSFSRDADYREMAWPDQYWPKSEAPPNSAAWDGSIDAFKTDLAAFMALVSDPQRDLLTPFPSKRKPLFRNTLILADHNSYHLGQLVFLRRLLDAW